MIDHPNKVWRDKDLHSCRISSFGLITLGQLQQINKPISASSSKGGILSRIFWRCGHVSATSGVGIWSRLDGMLSLAYALGSSTWRRLSSLHTIRPLILSTFNTSRPSVVLRFKLVLTPSMPSFSCTLVITKVMSLASSEIVYTFTCFSGLAWWNRSTKTIRQLVIKLALPGTELCAALIAF